MIVLVHMCFTLPRYAFDEHFKDIGANSRHVTATFLKIGKSDKVHVSLICPSISLLEPPSGIFYLHI